MARYKITIDTSAYKKMKCSKKNWEPGTVNDFMEALNGYQVTARSLKEVKKRLYIFMGCWNMCYDKETKFDWLNDPKNKCKITYYDKLCDMYRTDYVAPSGFKQGYFDIDKIIEELRAKKVVKIPFKTAYDIRQYIRNYDGCYMKIEVI